MQKVQAAVPKNTRNATSWAHAVWTDWIAGRQSASGADFPAPLQGITMNSLVTGCLVLLSKQGIREESSILQPHCMPCVLVFSVLSRKQDKNQQATGGHIQRSSICIVS